MANPTYLEVFGAAELNVAAALTALGLGGSDDSRYDVYTLLDTLNTKYQAIPEADRPTAYVVTKTARNIDIDTQRQTFTLTFDLLLTTIGMESEPVNP